MKINRKTQNKIDKAYAKGFAFGRKSLALDIIGRGENADRPLNLGRLMDILKELDLAANIED
jgi:hypothetical protein